MLPVSIIIPAYVNTGQGMVWFSECVQSAFENDCEVVVWDDGSSLDVQNACYIMNTTKFGFDTHKGVSHARNAAVKLATKPFIFPLDCDDVLKPGSIKKMLDVWDGKPIYPDVEKFGDTIVPHFKLLDFSCEELLKNVGPYPASVLHTREQHDSIGGWNESLDFYEDGDYNARLMLRYCGQRYPEPLLKYRFHENQRTRQYRGKESKYIKTIMQHIRAIARSDDMAGCCGGKRKTMFGKAFTRTVNNDVTIQTSAESIQVAFAAGELSMPLEADGKVLARYIGGRGKGKHVYKGNTKYELFRRIAYGDLVYAFPENVKDGNRNGGSLLVRVTQISTPIPAKIETATVQREPVVQSMQREPVIDDPFVLELLPEEPDEEEIDEAVDIGELTLKQIKKEITESDDAQYWIGIEKQGKNRKSVVEYLESILE